MMARPIPKHLARVLGSSVKNPKRYRARPEPAPAGEPLGPPPQWMSATQAGCWQAFQQEFPSLSEADRSLIELASALRSRLTNGELGIAGIAQYRLLLVALTDRSNAAAPVEPSPDATDVEKYLS
jgi:hypothetical protein